MANKKNNGLGKVIGQVGGARLRQVMHSVKSPTGKRDRMGKEVMKTVMAPSGEFAVCHGKKEQGRYSYSDMNDVKDMLNGN